MLKIVKQLKAKYNADTVSINRKSDSVAFITIGFANDWDMCFKVSGTKITKIND